MEIVFIWITVDFYLICPYLLSLYLSLSLSTNIISIYTYVQFDFFYLFTYRYQNTFVLFYYYVFFICSPVPTTTTPTHNKTHTLVTASTMDGINTHPLNAHTHKKCTKYEHETTNKKFQFIETIQTNISHLPGKQKIK